MTPVRLEPAALRSRVKPWGMGKSYATHINDVFTDCVCTTHDYVMAKIEINLQIITQSCSCPM